MIFLFFRFRRDFLLWWLNVLRLGSWDIGFFFKSFEILIRGELGKLCCLVGVLGGIIEVFKC